MGLVYSEPTCQAAYKGDVQRLYRFLSEDPNSLNIQEPRNGDTPLIAACRRGNVRVVKYLLDNQANVHLTNKKQRTCLHYVSKTTLSLLDFLLISLLMPILLLGYFFMLQKQRQTVALMEAVLSSRVNVNAVDYKGNTALHYVCKRKSHRLVPLLLDRKADVNVRNNKGNTALHYVCKRKSHRLVPLLLDRNADVNVRNNDGETPLDIAIRLKFNKIVHMLKKTQ